MKSSIGVKINISFANLVLQYISSPSEEVLYQICNHIVAKKILLNAQISDPNLKDIKDFWKRILESERNKGEEHISEIKSCIIYIENNTENLLDYVKELDNYLPDDFVFDCTLYLHVGYDIGIVAEDDALLNVGHDIFHQNKRELIYFALHELHHVGYTHYIDLELSFSDIQTTDDFVKLIEKLTHLEGTATYAIKKIRERDDQLSFFDYEVLNNKEKRTKSVKEYFEIYNKYKYAKNLLVEDSDF
ncbi:MAG: hypothetical protein KAQ95_01355, partial [Candidatus Heimdallarchaeota archaeon]|nr:hypothetical protein [Candidatus Heimdallarchaeota archaeon]